VWSAEPAPTFSEKAHAPITRAAAVSKLATDVRPGEKLLNWLVRLGSAIEDEGRVPLTTPGGAGDRPQLATYIRRLTQGTAVEHIGTVFLGRAVCHTDQRCSRMRSRTIVPAFYPISLPPRKSATLARTAAQPFYTTCRGTRTVVGPIYSGDRVPYDIYQSSYKL